LPEGVEAHLLIELDGSDSEMLMNEAAKVAEVLEEFGVLDVLFADSESQKNALWNLRRKVGEAVKMESIYKEEDTVVPRFELPRLLAGVKEIGEKYHFRTVCYGHAGDGNLHVNILRDDIPKQVWEEKIPLAIREIFQLTVSLGGTLSGEHGIGYVQKSYMDIAFNHLQINMMKDIKSVFDPQGILNPGKMFP
jgi:glycolate oxidase